MNSAPSNLARWRPVRQSDRRKGTVKRLSHAAALALVVWLMIAPPLRAAGAPIAVPGTADAQTRWDLMMAPPDFSHGVRSFRGIPFDPTRPLSEWRVTQTFPTEQECLAHLPGNAEDFRCIATDDPRLKGK
jgi:hypothetical protein